jgi:hypothetical protein
MLQRFHSVLVTGFLKLSFISFADALAAFTLGKAF